MLSSFTTKSDQIVQPACKEAPRRMSKLKNIVISALADLKAEDIQVLDVTALTLVTDHMIIATGNSHRHTQAIAKHVLLEVSKQRYTTIGVEGEQAGEWILLDLGDVIVHIMLASTREFYRLDKLWTPLPVAQTKLAVAV
jgi:ribosome-associated protein